MKYILKNKVGQTTNEYFIFDTINESKTKADLTSSEALQLQSVLKLKNISPLQASWLKVLNFKEFRL